MVEANKRIKYYFAIILSALCAAFPAIGVIIFVITWQLGTNNVEYNAISVALALVGLIMYKPIEALRYRAREEAEYDEYGMSKRKQLMKLSQKERDLVDLQKLADMERILNTTALKKMTKKGSVQPDKDLERLIGLEPVKHRILEMVARIKFEKGRLGKEKNQGEVLSGNHMVFYGNPGTGKTTVARIITGYLYDLGYIKENRIIEVDGNFLKANAPEESSTKTELVVRKAYGGVLFIDEAYALGDGDAAAGNEAISTLIKLMEDQKGEFVLILAGYTDKMNELLDKNPGFRSRIRNYISFPDYTMTELWDIFNLMADEQDLKVNPDAYYAFNDRMVTEMQLESWGNGRTVRNVLDETIDAVAMRYINQRIGLKPYKIIASDIQRTPRNIENLS